MSGTETEDLDPELLLAARSGELDAIASVCNHYRGRLLNLARNAGANEPESVVQNALTAALLEVEPVTAPSLDEFEGGLFERVVGDSGGLAPEATIDPSPEPVLAGFAGFAGLEDGVTTDDQFAIDTIRSPVVAPMVELAPPAGGVFLSPDTGPVDWSALAVDRADVGETPAVLSRRLVAGGGALLCGVGVVAAILIFLGGDGSGDEAAGPVRQAELVPAGGSGPEPTAGDAEQNRSSGTVTDGAAGSESTITVETSPTSTTTPTSSTAPTTVATSEPATTPSTASTSTAPPTTLPPSTVTPSTTRVETTSTTFRSRVGDFRNKSIDNMSFRRGDFGDHDFTGAVLNNVIFARADLSGVSFVGATLTNVRFTSSDLTGADFRGANMDDTDFEDTNISRTDFRGSVLTNGDFEGAWFSDDPIGWPDGDFGD